MLTLDALVNLTVASVQKGTKAEKQILKMFGPDVAKAVEESVASGTEKGAKRGSKKAASAFSEVYTKMLEVGLKKAGDDYEREFSKSERKAEAARREYQNLLRQERSAETIAEKKKFQKQLSHQKKLISIEERAQKKMLKRAEESVETQTEMLAEHDKRMMQSRTAALKEGGEQMSEMMAKAFDPGSFDFENIASGLMGAMGGGLRMGGGAAAGAGMGGAAAGLATAAASIAAVAGPLVALVAVLGKAYSQGKEMNKALLDSASSMDIFAGAGQSIQFMGGEVKTLTAGLAAIRDQSLGLASEMRLTSDETIGLYNGFFQSGMQLREFREIATGAAHDVEALGQVTRTAAMAAYGMGLEVSEVTGFIEKLGRDFGVNLTDFKEMFGDIAGAAQRAGMRTGDFFAAINEASSGMALYNFRVQDTVGLFEKLVEVLGEDMAKQQLGASVFRNMGTQEAYKQAMLGAGRESAVVSAQVMAEDVLAKMSEDGQALMSDYIKDGAIDIKKLASAGGEEFRAILAGLGDEEARRVQSLREISKATQGTGGRAIALGNLPMLGELAAQFEQGSAMFGGKMLSEMGAVERMSYESVTGVSGEDFRVRAMMQERLTADYERMVGEGGLRKDDGTVKSFTEALVAGDLTTADDMEKLNSGFNKVEQAAMDQLQATRSVLDQVQNVIASLLNKIAGGIDVIVELLSWGEDEQKAFVDKQQRWADRAEKSSQEIIRLQGVAGEFQKDLKDPNLTDEEKKQKQEDLANILAQIEGYKRSRKGETEIARKMARGESVDVDAMVLARLSEAKDAGYLSEGTEDWAKGLLQGEDTPEEILSALEAALTMDEQKKIQDDKDTKELKDATEGMEKAIVKELQAGRRDDKMAELVAMIEAGGAGETAVSALMKGALGGGKVKEFLMANDPEGEGKITVAEAALARALGIKGIKATSMNDFIVQDGMATAINPRDAMIYGKPGGPAGKMLGGGRSAVINIYGDEQRIYGILKRFYNEGVV